MELLIKLLPIIFRAINAAPQIQQAIRMGTPIDKAVELNARDLLPLFAKIGKEMFPAINEKFAPAAAASTMLDPIRIKWIQTALNAIGANPPLDVDGEYGPMTTEAVLQFQKAQGLVNDGWAAIRPTLPYSWRFRKFERRLVSSASCNSKFRSY